MSLSFVLFFFFYAFHTKVILSHFFSCISILYYETHIILYNLIPFLCDT